MTDADQAKAQSPETRQKAQKPSVLKRIPLDLGIIFILILALTNLVGLALTYRQNRQLTNLQAQVELRQSLGAKAFTLSDWEKIKQIPGIFPNEQEVIGLVAIFNQARPLFEQFSFSFEADSPLKDKGQPYLPFVITLSGPPQQILEFVNRLLNAPYVLKVTQVSALSQDNFANQTEVVIKANLYVSEKFN